MQHDSRQVVVVLGSGRSGTSLLMQVLVELGLQVSDNLVPANASNPEGFYEDVDLKDIQHELYSCLHGTMLTPLPRNWLDTECARKAKIGLTGILERLLQNRSGVLGIKDPRISTLLPLWVRLFNPLRVVPIYILALREPQSVISSFARQYNDPGHVAELVWLLRTVEAVENTAADCFIAHYEDWLTDAQSIAQALLHYTGLDQTFKGNLSKVLANIVKPNLNRASKDDYEIQNPYVLKLYTALKECHGAEFDRERLMGVVKECRQAMEGFKGWYQLAHQTGKSLADARARLEKLSAEAAKVKVLEKEKEQSAQLAAQVQKLQRQLDQLMALGGMQ
jgi:hypothetical protein